LRDARAKSIDDAVPWVMNEVDLARGEQAQEDDFTFCMLERRAAGRSEKFLNK
jgi:hypothetical protein